MKSPTRPKNAKKLPVLKGRIKPEMPEIFVKTMDGLRTEYVRASIRVKSGKYQYLMWRDGDRVKYFYLGQKKNS
jgi:hypothetical protein